MKISVVTPSYNQGKFINKCLNSVKAQRGDFVVEHIILDNCSNDQTYKELKLYKDNPGDVNVCVLIEKDSGQTAAINKGFALATGDIVCWLNTDEWYKDGAFEKVVEYLKLHVDVDVLFGDCDFKNTDEVLLKRKREFFFSWSMLMYYGCYIPSCSTFIRRKILDDRIFLNDDFKVSMDWDWYIRIARSGYKFAHLPLSLANFTWHDNNISIIYASRRKEERLILQERYGFAVRPTWIRIIVNGLMFYSWISVRVICRFIIKG